MILLETIQNVELVGCCFCCCYCRFFFNERLSTQLLGVGWDSVIRTKWISYQCKLSQCWGMLQNGYEISVPPSDISLLWLVVVIASVLGFDSQPKSVLIVTCGQQSLLHWMKGVKLSFILMTSNKMVMTAKQIISFNPKVMRTYPPRICRLEILSHKARDCLQLPDFNYISIMW